MSERRVVVTGMGLITCCGTGVEKTWQSIIHGQSGISNITLFDTSKSESKFGGQVNDFQPELFVEKKEVRRMDRFELFALGAADMAMKDAGLQITPEIAERVGCIVGSGIGGIGSLEEQHSKMLEKGPDRVSAFFILQMITNLAPGYITMKYGIKGPSWSTVSACSTSAHAIGEAMRGVQRGDMDICVTGGSEASLTPLSFAGFNAMKAMSTRNDAPQKASRPFDVDRDGFVMGEGAGILIIEELEHAKKRGARIHAELVGYGASSDAHHVTAPAPEHEGAQRCMKLALKDAKLNPSDIQYINTHGTSTPIGDVLEIQGVKKVFGDHAKTLAVSSTKSMTGHMLGAAGAAETVICIRALETGILPPTINVEKQDPEIDIDVVPNKAREVRLNTVMSNSFGFGGTNVTLIAKRFA
ncbi:MAG: beta-ketoacyl-ACP synthase II [Deltaproteobacteria bacterium]|nr:beta-ketoacyl-ACP synthase II [Deltaproteobacteria bacterium]